MRKKLPEEALKFFRSEGRKGGLLGSKIRKEKVSPERRSEIAKAAAQARWKGHKAKRSAASRRKKGS